MFVATARQADNRNDLKLDLCEPVVEARSVRATPGSNEDEVNTCTAQDEGPLEQANCRMNNEIFKLTQDNGN